MNDRDQTEKMLNRLADEKSPYLQQHATNPVEWYPWGEEAFEEARRRDVPIFLSIGYATCHWCHVMERESFEDEQTAAQMNRLFVNVKVDREERPDVDAIYMAAAQALTGQGGWPLSVWLTPNDRLPFYAGTYFPPTGMYGRPGFRELLAALSQAWDNDRARVEESARQITEAIRKGTSVDTTPVDPEVITTNLEEVTATMVPEAVQRFADSFDPEYGGFGQAPKFPRPSVLFFLLDAAATRLTLPLRPEALRDMVRLTLRRISLGGIHDHLGGGYARYSVDRFWRVPHFEKMLYDQGQLLEALARLHAESPDPLYEGRIRSTVRYLRRDMMDESGLFHAAEDADSEGEEGTFYVWSASEIDGLLDGLERDLFRRRYEVTPEGNFEGGRTILHTVTSLEDLASEFNLEISDVEEYLSSAGDRLFRAREQRERPLLDRKIIASWNGLLLSGLAWSARALDDEDLYGNAGSLADAIITEMWDGERLMRRMVDGELRYNGYLEDYAHLLKGLIDLYDVRQETRWLDHGVAIADRALSLFEDQENGGFYMADGTDQSLPVRTRSDHDGAEPSGNSTMAWSLARLGRILGVERYRNAASRTVLAYAGRIDGYPDVMPMLLSAALHLTSIPTATVIVESTDDPAGFERLLRDGRRQLGPFSDLVVLRAEGDTGLLREHLPYLSEMRPLDGRSVAYRCEEFTCGLPLTDLSE